MTALVDEISPSYIATELITITETEPEVTPQSFQAVLLDVDYTSTDQYGGIVLPLEMMVTPPSAEGFMRQLFSLFAPSQIAFTPQEGGQHLIVLREVGHNLAYGTIKLEVEGTINDPSVTQGQSS